MSKREPPIHWHNLFIFSQVLFQAGALVLLPLIALTLVVTTATVGWDHCSLQDCTSMQRLGALWSAGGFLYVLVEEVWRVTPQNMHQEVEGSLSLIEDDLAGATKAKREFRAFAVFTEKARLPLVRTIEIGLVVGGTLLDGYGDMFAGFA